MEVEVVDVDLGTVVIGFDVVVTFVTGVQAAIRTAQAANFLISEG
ncbi:MAG: hypothetical protein OEX97_09640 [Acidimicrobiia bacterium]|nr:hypothetical protein [Acidimicrobiia bacterium]